MTMIDAFAEVARYGLVLTLICIALFVQIFTRCSRWYDERYNIINRNNNLNNTSNNDSTGLVVDDEMVLRWVEHVSHELMESQLLSTATTANNNNNNNNEETNRRDFIHDTLVKKKVLLLETSNKEKEELKAINNVDNDGSSKTGDRQQQEVLKMEHNDQQNIIINNDDCSPTEEAFVKSNSDNNHTTATTPPTTATAATTSSKNNKYFHRLKSNLFLRKNSTSTETSDIESGTGTGTGTGDDMVLDDISCHSSKSNRPMCSICLRYYHIGDDICWSQNMHCQHHFHDECISQWLLRHNECPCCRQNYMERKEQQNDQQQQVEARGEGSPVSAMTTARTEETTPVPSHGDDHDIEEGSVVIEAAAENTTSLSGGSNSSRQQQHRRHHNRNNRITPVPPLQSATGTGGSTTRIPGNTRRFQFRNTDLEISLVDTQFLLALQHYADVIRVARQHGGSGGGGSSSIHRTIQRRRAGDEVDRGDDNVVVVVDDGEHSGSSGVVQSDMEDSRVQEEEGEVAIAEIDHSPNEENYQNDDEMVLDDIENSAEDVTVQTSTTSSSENEGEADH